MIRLSSLTSSSAVLGASLAAHAAALVVTLGHPALLRSAPDGPSLTQTVDVELATEMQSESDPDHTSAPGAAHVHTHTHSYPVPASHDLTPHDPSLVHVLPSLSSPAAAPHEPAAAPAALAAESETTPHFVLPIGGGGSGSSSSSGAASPGAGASEPSAPPAPSSGDTLPEQLVTTPARLLRGASPPYPPRARDEGIQADVPMELVVSAAGGVETARVLRNVGYGLDEAALHAIHAYAFAPATKDGRPVRVRMGWTMQFRLRSSAD